MNRFRDILLQTRRRVSNFIIFIGNPDVNSLNVVGDASSVLTYSNVAIMLGYCIESFRSALISLILSAELIRAGKNSRLFGGLAM